jgi:hypothetical protein
MIKRIVLISLVAVMLIVPASVLAGKDYVAERFDVDIILNTDGSMLVTETIAFRFMGGPFTYVYRDLDKTRTDGISFISAELDGIPLPVSGETALQWVEVEDGDPLNVTWHFQPTTDQIHTYALTYQVDGIVRKYEVDSIVWMAIPQEHDYRVQGSRITIRYPDGAEPIGEPVLGGTSGYQIESDGNPLTLAAGPVEADTPLILTLNFKADSLSPLVPGWQITQQERLERTSGTTPYTVISFLITFITLMVSLIIVAVRPVPMDETTSLPAIIKPVSPPTDYRPAVASVLVALMTPNMMHSLGTLIDLAQRGFLSIEQLPGKWYSPNRYSFIRQPSIGQLAPHEQVLMEALFTKRGSAIEQSELSEYTQLLSKRWSDFSKAIKLEISMLGLIQPERKKRQTHVLVASVCMLLVGFFLSIGLVIFIGVMSTSIPLATHQIASGFLGFFIAAFISGIVYIIYAALYSPLSAQGRWIAGQWKGFARHLKDIIAQREQALRPDTFSLFLPYAAGLGLGSQWAKTFQKRGSAEVPDWFHALNAQEGDGSFGAFTAFMTHSATSVSSSGGGGGSGASGGGGSGAG